MIFERKSSIVLYISIIRSLRKLRIEKHHMKSYTQMLKKIFSQMIVEMNSLITKVRLLKAQTTNEHLLKEDEKILKSSFNSENDEKSDNEEVVAFDEKEDYELVRALEDALLMSLFFEVDVEITFHIQLLIRTNDQHQAGKRDSERVFLATLQEDFLRI